MSQKGKRGKARVFKSGAQRDANDSKPYVHNILGYTRLRYGYHSNMGSHKYGDGNFRKGIPTEAALESLDRHLAKYKYNIEKGLPQDEDHLSAMIFNIQLCMMNEDREGMKPDHFFKEE